MAFQPELSFRKYACFGFVDVSTKTSLDNVTSFISILDNFSSRRYSFIISDKAAMDTVEFTDESIFFFVSKTGAIYAFRKQILFQIQRNSETEAWEWTTVDQGLSLLKTEQLPLTTLTEQWSHWKSWTNPTEVYDSRASRRNYLWKIYVEFNVQKICAGHDHLVILDDSGKVYTCGSGNHGELGHGSLDSLHNPLLVESLLESGMRIVDIAAGGWHSCALTDDGDVYGWGWNKCGQLGFSPTEFTIQPVPYPFDIDQRVTSVYCKNNTTCFTLHDNLRTFFGERRV
ncbi:regulator of chromosome condensation (RCC1) repeat domain-containing protein [Ditylenchus destructor]|nr:regulator of chromosome condensation (RCC1) repeat domain-containing protein [Ditylenchus destructor]